MMRINLDKNRSGATVNNHMKQEISWSGSIWEIFLYLFPLSSQLQSCWPYLVEGKWSVYFTCAVVYYHVTPCLHCSSSQACQHYDHSGNSPVGGSFDGNSCVRKHGSRWRSTGTGGRPAGSWVHWEGEAGKDDSGSPPPAGSAETSRCHRTPPLFCVLCGYG